MTKLSSKMVKVLSGRIYKEAAFQLLKQKLYSAPILALPEGEGEQRFYRILRCFKEWFGRCDNANRKDAIRTEKLEPLCWMYSSIYSPMESGYPVGNCAYCDHARCLTNQISNTFAGSNKDVPNMKEAILVPNMKGRQSPP
ncbi:hypothetical protein Tco_1576265 [Tanacetum coccineum]